MHAFHTSLMACCARLSNIASWLKHPQRFLLLILLCTPLAWATVNITGMVITTFKQVSFAQTAVEMAVSSSFTQTASVRYSRGAIAYTSSNATVATVDAQSGAVVALQPGTTTITALQTALAPYPSASASYTVRVSGQAVVFSAWTLPPVVFGSTAFTLTAPTSNSPGAITYTSERPAVAEVTPQGVVTVRAVGKTRIVAQLAANGVFAPGSLSAELEVLPAVPVLSWSTQTVTLGGTVTLQPPTSVANHAGSFTYTVVDTTLADVAGNQLTGKAVGATRIRAQLAASGNYAAASVEADLTVSAAAFVIAGFSDIVRTFDAVDSSPNAFDLPTLSKPSGSTGVYTFTSSNTAVATVAGQRVTALGVGDTTLTAQLSADPLRHEAATASVTLRVLPAVPVATFNPVYKAVGDAAFIPPFTSNSTGAVTFSLSNAQPADLATLAGNGTITVVKPGTATLVATQVAAGNFAGTTATTAFTITAQPLIANTLALAPFEKLTSDAAFVPAWTSRNSAAAPITVSSTNTAVATVANDGQTLTLTGNAGSSQITLSQPASATHTAASVSAVLTVRQRAVAAASLTLAALTKTFGDSAFSPSVGTSSDGLVTFSSSNTAVAVVDNTGRVVTIVGAGSTNITARVASTANFGTAEATAVLTVNPRDPALQVKDVYRQLAMGPFDLVVDRLGAGAIAVTSSNPAVVSVGGSQGLTLTPNGPGKATVTVALAADANHTASSASATINITAEKASLVWPVPPQITYAAGNPTVALPALASNNRSGAISYSSSNSGVATIANNTLTLTGQAGTVVLTATQAAGDGYLETQISATVNITLTAPTSTLPVAPTLVVDALIERALAQGAFQPSIQTNSTGAVTLSVLYGPLTLGNDGRTLTPTMAGEAGVKVTVAATANFTAAEKTIVIKLSAGAPVIQFLAMTRTYDDTDTTFDITTPVSNSSGAFTYTSLDPNIAEIVSASQIKVKGAGAVVIRAVQAAAFPYATGQADATLTVSAQPNTLSFGVLTALTRTTSDLPFNVRATSNSPMTILYLSTNEAVATVDSSGQVTLKGAVGTTSIVASQITGWTRYAPGRAEVGLSVSLPEATGLTLFDFNASIDRRTVLTPFTTMSSRAVVVAVDNSTVATVEPDGKTLRLKAVGSTRVTVKHPATSTQAEVSVNAVLTVAPAAAVISGLPATIERTWAGTPQSITLEPTSPSNGEFSLSSDAVDVAQVSGLTVRLVGPGTASLTLTQGTGTSWSGTSVVIPVRVNQALATLENMIRTYGDPGFELPASLNGTPVTYISSNTAVAVIGGAGSRTVSLAGVGTTALLAISGANTVIAEATLSVSGGLPKLIFQDIVLPSTTMVTTLKATSSSTGAISYAVTGGAIGSVQLNAQGVLLVRGTGTVQVTATQAADTNHASRSVTANITIANGDPGFIVTSAPSAPVRQGDTFEIRYRANSLAEAEGIEPLVLFASHGNLNIGGFMRLVSQSTRTRVDEDGVMVFQVDANAPVGGGHRIGFSFRSVDAGFNLLQASEPPLARNIEVAVRDQQYNLGLPFTLDFNIANPMAVPPVRDSNGNAAPTISCRYASSNTAVLRESFLINEPYPGWRTVGAGEATLSCSNNPGIRSVTVSVLPGDPEPKGFESMNLSMDAVAQNIVAPTSLNKTGLWTYEVLNSQNQAGATVAVIENGVVIAKAPGSAVLRATQAAASNYRQAQIDALITVAPSVLTGFQDLTMTFGDADFRMPMPISNDTITPFVLTSSNSNVATITDGNLVSIKGAGSVTITARQGQSVPVVATLTVRKAVPKLAFRVAPGTEFEQDTCRTRPFTYITWPLPNESVLPGVSFTSDSDGAVQYQSTGGFTWNGQSGNVGLLWRADYNFPTEPAPVLTYQVWVTQAESANFLAATSQRFDFTVTDRYPLWSCPM